MNRNEKNYLKFRADHDVSLETVSKNMAHHNKIIIMLI